MKSLKLKTFAFCFLFSVLITGCITRVSMTKVTPSNPNPEGLRVYYPAQFLVGRMSTNGLITYDIESLPDPNAQYAISSKAILSKYTVSISRSPEMYLTELDLNQDSTAVAGSALTSAGQIGTAYLQALQQKQNQNNTGTNPPTTGGGGSTTGGGGSTTGGGGTGATNNNNAIMTTPGPIVVMYQIIVDANGVQLKPTAFNIVSFHWMTNGISISDNLTQSNLFIVPTNIFDQ